MSAFRDALRGNRAEAERQQAEADAKLEAAIAACSDPLERAFSRLMRTVSAVVDLRTAATTIPLESPLSGLLGPTKEELGREVARLWKPALDELRAAIRAEITAAKAATP